MIPDARLKRTVRQDPVLPMLGQHPVEFLLRYLHARGLTSGTLWKQSEHEDMLVHSKITYASPVHTTRAWASPGPF